MNIIIIETVGIIAAGIDLSMSVPQAWRIHKNKNADGVSLITWAVLYTTLIGWGTYGYVNNSVGLSLGFTIGAITIGGLILTSVLKYQNANMLKRILVIAGIPAFTILFILFMHPVVTAVFLFLLTFNRVPQIIKSYKNWKTSTPTNVSLATWTMGLLANLSWMTYGILRNDPTIIAVTIPALFYDTTIITFETLNTKNRLKSKK